MTIAGPPSGGTTAAPAAVPHRRGAAIGPSDGDRLIVDVAAPVFIWCYFVLVFQPFETFFIMPGSVSGVLLPALGACILVATPADRLARIPISLVLGTVVSWLMLSVLWSEVPSFTQYLIRAQLLPLIALALVVGTMKPADIARVLTTIFLAIGVWSLATGVLVPTSRATVLDEVELLGLRGGFIHKNVLGVFMVCGLCTVLPFVRSRARPWAIGLCVAVILGTRSATAAGGLLGVMFVWGWMAAIAHQRSPRERQFLLLVSFTSAIAGVLLLLGLAPTLLDLYDKDLTFSGRTDIWTESLITFRERPVQGYGLGGVWSDPASPVTADLHHRITFEAAHSHSSVIELLLEGGIVGLTLTVLFVVQTIRLALACLRQPSAAAYGQWGLLIVLALLFMGLAEPLFGGPHLGLLVIVWVTLARVRNEGRRGAWSARPQARRRAPDDAVTRDRRVAPR